MTPGPCTDKEQLASLGGLGLELPEVGEVFEEGLRGNHVGLLALAPSDNLRYALGFSPFADERVCLLLVSEQGLAFIVPTVNADQAAVAARRRS